MFNIRPYVDGFVTKWNRQTGNYVSWVQEEDAESTNSLFQTWADNRIWWLFPPISILQQVVNKIILEKPSAILITPDWKTLSVMAKLNRINMGCEILPKITQCCPEGLGISAANSSLPPGRLIAWRI
ncbi:MAG: hypothetical protein EZS28_047200 [Streblomastix strix]|uniref:Uncharacterized protein n=1 Tax=Streblomastix strix TaxID=222440 RepID=A0A5J4THH4_9EUKA|nr:MAG: hypothetical protein EZS28_047200 [Streblomastix strix]